MRINLPEISTLGFISNINDFTKLISVCHMPVQLKQEIISTVLKSSFAIYSHRNNAAMIKMIPRYLSDSGLSTKLLISL